MTFRIVLLTCAVLSLPGCVQKPVFDGEGRAQVRSSYPIVSVNGEAVEPVYRIEIEARDTTLVVVYNTYRNDYYCTFSWTASENATYEVTNQENRYPLTMFSWVRTNSLWASRLDPMDPQNCLKKAKR